MAFNLLGTPVQLIAIQHDNSAVTFTCTQLKLFSLVYKLTFNKSKLWLRVNTMRQICIHSSAWIPECLFFTSLRLSHAVKLNFVTIALAGSFTCMSLSKLISLCSMCFKSQCSFSILPLTFICARTTSSWSVREYCYHQHLHSTGSMRIGLKLHHCSKHHNEGTAHEKRGNYERSVHIVWLNPLGGSLHFIQRLLL